MTPYNLLLQLANKCILCTLIIVGFITIPSSWADPIVMPTWPNDPNNNLIPKSETTSTVALAEQNKTPTADSNGKLSAIKPFSKEKITESPIPLATQMVSSEKNTSPDQITAEHIDILRETGLIARQSAIAESIIIMERQLRQAELIQQLMKIYGPNTPIEIAPGEYKTFGTTPAGRKISAEIEVAETMSRIRLLELKSTEDELTNINPDKDIPLQFSQEITLNQSNNAPIWPKLMEIFGTDGDLRASLLFDNEEIIASSGDILPDGSNVVLINNKSVLLKKNTVEKELRLGW